MSRESGLYKRGNVWWIKYGHRGKVYRESSKSHRKADARALRKKRLGELGAGTFVGRDAERVTFEDLATLIVSDYTMEKRRSLDRLQIALSHLRDHFGEMRALDVTGPGIRAYILRRQDQGAADSTISTELAALKRAFNLAVKDEVLQKAPPFPTLTVENVRPFCPTDAEVAAIIAELERGPPTKKGKLRFDDPPSRHAVPVVRFAALIGWRLRECLRLQWHEVDFDAGTIHLPARKSKNKRARVLPFAALPELAELLEERRAVTDAVERAQGRIVPYVFHRDGEPIKDFRGAWKTACKRAGVRWTVKDEETGETKTILPVFHDLRRVAVTNLTNAGVPRSWAMKITGHKTESIFDRYCIEDAESLGEALQGLARYRENRTPDRTATPLLGTVRAQSAAVGE